MQRFSTSPQRIQPSLGLAFETGFAVATLQTIAGMVLGATLLRMRFGSDIGTILFRESKGMVWLGLLHAIGACGTNLGFLYGTASLVQILKVSEPFQTLGWSVMLGEETSASFQHLSSILVLVGGAMAVVSSHPTPPHVISVASALVTGLSLTLRNVVQRKISNKTFRTSMVHFTLMSLFASLWSSFGTVLALILTKVDASEGRQPLLEGISLGTIFYHPIFSLASIVTLGIWSALTHALLNNGKRIVSVLVSIFLYDEEWTRGAVAGLVACSFGTIAYINERRHQHDYEAGERGGLHPLIAVAILLCLFWLPGDDE